MSKANFTLVSASPIPSIRSNVSYQNADRTVCGLGKKTHLSNKNMKLICLNLIVETSIYFNKLINFLLFFYYICLNYFYLKNLFYLF